MRGGLDIFHRDTTGGRRSQRPPIAGRGRISFNREVTSLIALLGNMEPSLIWAINGDTKSRHHFKGRCDIGFGHHFARRLETDRLPCIGRHHEDGGQVLAAEIGLDLDATTRQDKGSYAHRWATVDALDLDSEPRQGVHEVIDRTCLHALVASHDLYSRHQGAKRRQETHRGPGIAAKQRCLHRLKVTAQAFDLDLVIRGLEHNPKRAQVRHHKARVITMEDVSETALALGQACHHQGAIAQ